MLVQQRIKHLVFVALIAAFTFALAITPATPAKAAPPSAPDVSYSGCTVHFSFIADASGTYTFEVYDDGNELLTLNRFASAGESVDFFYTVTAPILQGAAGIGFYISFNGAFVYVDGSNNVLDGCVAIAGCQLSDGAYQVKLSKTVQVYYGPDEGSPVAPVTVIPGGKTVTVVSGDANWVKIIWSCQYLYIKNEGLGINYEQSSKAYPSFGSNK
jgi:hypothetical protein